MELEKTYFFNFNTLKDKKNLLKIMLKIKLVITLVSFYYSIYREFKFKFLKYVASRNFLQKHNSYAKILMNQFKTNFYLDFYI